MKYSPKPLDTSLVKLPEYLLELTEFLAENVHDIWACSRMEEGWTYGPQRDDMKQEHPSIVPLQRPIRFRKRIRSEYSYSNTKDYHNFRISN